MSFRIHTNTDVRDLSACCDCSSDSIENQSIQIILRIIHSFRTYTSFQTHFTKVRTSHISRFFSEFFDVNRTVRSMSQFRKKCGTERDNFRKEIFPSLTV